MESLSCAVCVQKFFPLSGGIFQNVKGEHAPSLILSLMKIFIPIVKHGPRIICLSSKNIPSSFASQGVVVCIDHDTETGSHPGIYWTLHMDQR